MTQELCKEPVSRIVALDIGEQRIGVAVSDPLGITAQPLLTIQGEGRSALKQIRTLLETYRVRTLVVGSPLEMNGCHGEQAEKVRGFTQRLKTFLSSHPLLSKLEVVFIDERLTTVQAEQIVIGGGLKNRQRRAARDRIAAAIILDTYLLSR